MVKDQTILNIVDKLRKIVDAQTELVDHWDADLCAIGFKNKEKLFYISTYNYKNETEPRYDYDLESINNSKPDEYTLLKEMRNVSENDLIREFKNFISL